ncbi:MAG: ABC transporter ATP-binding protein [Azospirillaceae bacterium]|nr:ABC transporter ATP-binding protein [Azospirillaceae bacterium]
MSDLLQVTDLEVEFRQSGEGIVSAVRGVSFRIRPGETVALVGESGSGKSVVAQSIMGILPRNGRIAGGEIRLNDPVTGTIVISKLDRDDRRMRALRGNRMAMVFQEPMTSLSPVHRIGDQIGEAYRLRHRASRTEVQERTEETLRLVGFPNPRQALRSYPFELSGGLRQRAVIAMGLICRPSLLIADEPTTALDVTIQAQILKLLFDLQQQFGMAILMITHDLGVVANLAREVLVMYQGRIVESGPRDDLFANPCHPYLKALLHAVPRFREDNRQRLVPIREIASEGGQLLSRAITPWPADGDRAGPLLSVAGVSKSYHGQRGGWFAGPASAGMPAVDDISFTIRRGECLGLVGESGCGKTTLAKILMRAITPDQGRVLFNNRGHQIDVLGLDGHALMQWRQRQQIIFQDPFGSLDPRMTVFDIIVEPLVIHRVGSAEERQALVEDLMALVGLERQHVHRHPHSFSGGQRQRIGIARALALRPDLVLCDEPVSALDVSIQAQILNLLKDLQSRLGLTYLFISHNLAVVDYLADRVMVMCQGRIVEIAPRKSLFCNPVHPYTQTLLLAVPNPDPRFPLDFTQLGPCRTSDPGAWPAPFTIPPAADPASRPRLIDLGNDHWVRATKELTSCARA